MSDLHVHFHGAVAAGATLIVQVPPTGAIAAQLNQLKELITMNEQELMQELDDMKAKAEANTAQIAKGITEVLVEISKQGQLSPAAVAKVQALRDVLNAQGATTQELDDIVADVPPTP